ncbi:MAG: hypothetical protein Q9175_008296, partial [Cornicularia normoerica]
SGRASSHGPFDLDCTVDESNWQGFNTHDTGLSDNLEVQSGHACSFDDADNNLENLHAKYVAQYLNVPAGMNAGHSDTFTVHQTVIRDLLLAFSILHHGGQ